MASSSGNMNEEEGASDNNPGDLNKEMNPSSSSINDGNRGCTCKKTQCLKLYCKCFNSGNFCNDSCSCRNCLNNEKNKDRVEEIKKNILWRDPEAFESKIGARNRTGCHCYKAECMKNHCGCFRNRVACSLICLCQGCKNKYGIKGSSSGAKEQEPVKDSNSGSKNVETMDTGSSSQSPHANSSTQLSENSDAGMDDEMGNSNVNNIPMSMPSNQVASPDYDFSVHQNHVDAPYYDLSRNNITEEQSTNLFGDQDWQGQSSFLSSPLVYDDNVTELSSIPRIQSSQQYQPHQSHGFHQQVEASFGAMTLQHPFLRSSQQPNNGDATNMQLLLHPHLHGHGPSSTIADYEENSYHS
ncbi:hypothetical protein PIB30_014575 [Stylosanthes scabra]|uniref:CRC domain-containing protein n=1 Tax=Stylosanthes scabra TaxID=79078 RepID=A0ABU6Q6L0_9FABA|nr:hypothetical protein [Stylosanthes scabra]